MHSGFLRLLVLAAASMMTACASSNPHASALPRPLPAAALQLCPAPPAPPGAEVDEVAAALMDMYGLYGQCAALHADLVRALEGGQR